MPRDADTFPEGADRGLAVGAHGDPEFARERFVVVCGERVVVVGPQGADAGGADGLDGVEQSAVVAGPASAILAVVEIVPDESLEVFELSGRDEDSGVGGVVAMADVAQLDALALAREALEREIDVREALELDLDAETVLCLFGVDGRVFGGRANLAELGA